MTEARNGAERVTASIAEGDSVETAVKRLRNDLNIEAVAAISEGIVVAATAPELVGTSLSNPVLSFGHNAQRVTAIAVATTTSLSVDGVTEWQSGDVLYQVHQPSVDGGPSLLLFYDIGELLERRIRTTGITAATLQLVAASLGMAMLAALLLVGRARTARRYRDLARESEVLRRHATELTETNLQLEEAKRQAEHALALAEETNRIRAEFVLMINHELRTPLASVVTGAELLQTDAGLTEADRKTIIEDMVTDGNRLYGMIAQMLAVARIENRGFEFDLRPVRLAELCDDVGSAHPKLQVDHSGVSREVVESMWVRTDAQTVAQLIASLTDNAFNHGASSVVLECSEALHDAPMLVKGTMPDDAVYLSVVDDGPGIDEEFLPRIFEKFEKKSFSSGTGLGLYLAQMMAEALEAAIAVHTSPNGTRMTLAIPIVPAANPVGVAA